MQDRPDVLPTYVGYAEVQKHLTLSRRTIEREVRAGKFPRPVQLASNRVGWRVETVLEWAAARDRDLVASAVATPAELTPDQIQEELHSLAADFLTTQLRSPVRSEDISIRLVRESLEPHDPIAAVLAEFDGRFDHFEAARAWFVAAWLFPSLIEYLTPATEEGRKLFSDQEQLRLVGSLVMDDRAWAEWEPELQKLFGNPS